MRKVVFVTGAARGIGKEICLVMAKEGYDISLNYRTKTDEVDELKKEIESYGVKCTIVQGDVGSYEECERMVNETVEALGTIDVLVNNAGITKDGLLMRMNQEDFTRVIDVNLVGTFNVTRNVIPLMVKQSSGRIINIASVVGIAGNAGQTNYAASKLELLDLRKA